MPWKSVAAARAAFAHAIGRWFGRVAGPFRHTDPDLARMSDRELCDLGIGRSEVGWWGDSRATGPHAARDGEGEGDEPGDASRRR